jgi:hypothetical protein
MGTRFSKSTSKSPVPLSSSEEAPPHFVRRNSPPTHTCLQAAARIAGKPDIFEAAEKGDLALVKDHCIVDPGCTQNRDKLPPSSFQDSSCCVRFLIFIFILLCPRLRHGYTALHRSCQGAKIPVCRILVDAKANLEAKDKYHAPFCLLCFVFYELFLLQFFYTNPVP